MVLSSSAESMFAPSRKNHELVDQRHHFNFVLEDRLGPNLESPAAKARRPRAPDALVSFHKALVLDAVAAVGLDPGTSIAAAAPLDGKMAHIVDPPAGQR
jgi:hypothetical protein